MRQHGEAGEAKESVKGVGSREGRLVSVVEDAAREKTEGRGGSVVAVSRPLLRRPRESSVSGVLTAKDEGGEARTVQKARASRRPSRELEGGADPPGVTDVRLFAETALQPSFCCLAMSQPPEAFAQRRKVGFSRRRGVPPATRDTSTQRRLSPLKSVATRGV